MKVNKEAEKKEIETVTFTDLKRLVETRAHGTGHRAGVWLFERIKKWVFKKIGLSKQEIVLSFFVASILCV